MQEVVNERTTGDQGWWQSLPGVVTAVTGLITAIAGLILAANQAGFLHSPPTKAPAGTVSKITISFPAIEQAAGDCSYMITWARGKGPSIKLGVQVRNRGKSPFMLTSDDFRLRVNGATSAPTEGPNESIAAGDKQTGYVTFSVPLGIESAQLLVGKPGRMALIPLSMQ